MYQKNSKLLFSLILLITACGGGGGGGGGNNTPPPSPAPTLSFSASPVSVLLNNTSTFSWSTTNATSCTASGSTQWSGSKATSGTEDVPITISGNTTFTLSCSGAGGSRNASVTVEGYRQTDGVVVDGYISGADVFIDENENFIADAQENATTSDNDGKFTIKYANGSLVSIGGTDLDSQTLLDNLLITHKLDGFSDFKAITPVTSVDAFLESVDINAALGIDSSINIAVDDPVALKGDGGIYDYLYEKGNQLTVLAYALQNITNDLNTTTETTQDFFKSIAEEVETEYTQTQVKVDIETTDFISKVLTNVETAKTLNLNETDKSNTVTALASVIPIIQVKEDADTTTSLIRFGVSQLQEDIVSLANGSASEELVEDYTQDVINYIATIESISSDNLTPDISSIDDSASVDEDAEVDIFILNNDSFVAGAPFNISTTLPMNGDVEITNNYITYTPDTDYFGDDDFSYTLSQGDKTASADVNITINSINDAPSIDVASTLIVSENQTAITTISISDVDEDELTLTLGGTDASSLNLSAENVLSFKEAPDYESKDNYSINLSLTDGTETTDKDISILITDINDVAPVFTSSASFNAPENQLAIGTVSASDEEDDELNFSISGEELAITLEGVLTFVSAPDFETKPSYSAVVTVSDGINEATQDITVNVTNVNDIAPVFTSETTFNAAENQTAIGTVTATDAEGDDVTFTVTGDELAITPIGTLTFVSQPDFETKIKYTATITASDGVNSSSQSIIVNVLDVDEIPPVISINGANPVTVELGSTYSDAGAIADGGETVSSESNVDTAKVGSYTVTYSATDAAGNTGTATRVVNVLDTTAPTIIVIGDNPTTTELGLTYTDKGATASDLSDEVSVTTSGTVDINTIGSYTLTYSATDASGNTGNASRTVNVVDTTGPSIVILGNNPATVELGSDYIDSGASADGGETVTSSSNVDTSIIGSYTVTYSATDASNNTSSVIRVVNIIDTTAPAITVIGDNPATIELGAVYEDAGASATDLSGDVNVTTSGEVDTNTVGSYTLTYSATDSSGNTATANRTVKVNDTTAPVFSSPATFSIEENQTAIGTVTASDLSGDVAFTIASDEMNITSDGVLSFISAPDYEIKSQYTATVTASDGTNTSTQNITINVTNVNDNSPVFTSSATFSIAENQTAIGTVTATDADGEGIAYSISGSDITINSSSGIIAFASAPDYEIKSQYTATVTASDGTNTSTQNITINVTNVNDNSPVFTSSATFSIAENQTAIGTVTATDADGEGIAYSISGSDITINSSSGIIAFASAPDYEIKSQYTATVTASDGTNTSTQNITINVTNVNDNSPVFTSSATFSIAENQTAIGTVTATDADGDSVTFSVSGSELEITSSGVLTFTSAPDYETKSSYTASITVSDGVFSDLQDITVIIIDSIDEDGDSIPDEWEILYGLNSTNSSDASSDLDGDGLTALQEYNNNTIPYLRDTDKDGLSDKWEVDHNKNPSIPNYIIEDNRQNYRLCSKGDLPIDGYAYSETSRYGHIGGCRDYTNRDLIGGAQSSGLSVTETEYISQIYTDSAGKFMCVVSNERPYCWTYDSSYPVDQSGNSISSYDLSISSSNSEELYNSLVGNIPKNVKKVFLMYGKSSDQRDTHICGLRSDKKFFCSNVINDNNFNYQLYDLVEHVKEYNFHDIYAYSGSEYTSFCGLLTDLKTIKCFHQSGNSASYQASGEWDQIIEVRVRSDLIGNIKDFSFKDSYVCAIDGEGIKCWMPQYQVIPNIYHYEDYTNINADIVSVDSYFDYICWTTLTDLDCKYSRTREDSESAAHKNIARSNDLQSFSNASKIKLINYQKAYVIDEKGIHVFGNFNGNNSEMWFNYSTPFDFQYGFFFADPDGDNIQSYEDKEPLESDVGANNSRPVFVDSTFQEISILEGETNVINLIGDDDDGDELKFYRMNQWCNGVDDSPGGFSKPNDSSLFNVSENGAVSFKSPPDYENPSDISNNFGAKPSDNTYEFCVRVTDGGSNDFKKLNISVTDKNESAPVINSSSTFTMDENDTVVGIILATDADGDNLTYSISNSEFIISTSSGNLFLQNNADYEIKTSYTAKVSVTDGTYTTSQDIIVNVTNLNDNSPSFTSSATFSADENQTAIESVTATDADGDSVTFTVSGSELEITSSGVLTFTSAPDFETKSVYTATLTASDGTNSTTQDITVNVTDVDENVDTGPVFTSDSTFEVAENQLAIGEVTATDPDGDSISFSTTSTEILIDSLNGNMTFVSSPNFEAKSVYTATILASDGVNESSQDITINITNVVEAPEAFDKTIIFRVLPQIQTEQNIILPADGDNLTYIIVSNPSKGTLTLNGNIATYKTFLNYTTSDTDSFTFKVSNGSEESSVATLSIDIMTDPLYKYQWHLENTGQTTFATNAGTADEDLNLNTVISSGYSGAGVTVAVIDSGLEIGHEDLADNMVAGSYDFLDSDTDPTNTIDVSGDHGTSVAGIIAATGWNGLGGRGVAPDASLVGYNLLQNGFASYQLQSWGINPPVEANVDIYNMSYGNYYPGVSQTFALPDFLDAYFEDALVTATTELRSGKGALYVQSSGNEYSDYATEDCGENEFTCVEVIWDNWSTVPYILQVGALNANGQKSSYTTTGAALWVSGFGGETGANESILNNQNLQLPSGIYEPAILTTDQSSCAKGYVSTNVSTRYNEFENSTGSKAINSECNYTSTFGGTSSAAPTVAGVMALIISANPDLTWRDVKHIIASTSDQVGADSDYTYDFQGINQYEWETNSAGYKFHNWFGFGKINAADAVDMALSMQGNNLGAFQTTGFQQEDQDELVITDAETTSATIEIIKPDNSNNFIEFVRVSIQFNHLVPKSIGLRLVSPDGTEVNIMQPMTNLGTNPANTLFDIGVSGLYGESIEGTWTLYADDYIEDAIEGSLIQWGIEIYGN